MTLLTASTSAMEVEKDADKGVVTSELKGPYLHHLKLKQDIFGSGLIFPEPSVSIAGSLQSLPQGNDDAKSTTPATRIALDGGWGWVIVASTFVAQIALSIAFLSFGIIYVDVVEEFGGRSGPIGWIGSVMISFGYLSSIPVSIVVDMYGCRVVTFVAGLLLSLGFLLGSFATTPQMMLCTYGFLGGSGFGAAFMGCVVIVQHYFDKHRALAASLASAGLSAGSLVTGPLVQFLIDTYGWRGAVMIEAGVFLHIPLMALFFRPASQYRMHLSMHSKVTARPSQKRRGPCGRKVCEKLGDLAIMKDVNFLLICASGFLLPLAFTGYMIHTPSRAVFYSVERRVASMLPTVIGGASFTARIVFGCLANLQCTNRLLMYSIGGISMSVIILLTTMATQLPRIVVCCVGFGFTAGCYTTVQPTALVDLVGISMFPRAQGVYMIFFGASALVSVPLVGYILDVTQDYSIGFLVTGSCGVLGGFLALLVPLLKMTRKKRVVEDIVA